MSLKQRAMQCSGYIPPGQYVPVYSRPHRSNNLRLHEEISPITPKPALDDPYNSRTRTIHEAVKAWLESSPNSVIGPVYRSRSPSSGSPPSHSSSFGQAQAIRLGSSSSSFDRIKSSPVELECYDGYGVTTAVSSSFQEDEVKSRPSVVQLDGDRSPSSSDKINSSANGFAAEVEDPWAQGDKGTITFDQWETSERSVPILSLKSRRSRLVDGSSEEAKNEYRAPIGDSNYRLASGVVSSQTDHSTLDIEKAGPVQSSAAPEISIKLPRIRDMVARDEVEPKAANKKVTFDLPTRTSTTESGRSFEDQNDVPTIDERRFIEGANVTTFEDFSGATPVFEQAGFTDRRNLKNSNKFATPVGPKKRSEGATQTLAGGVGTEITESVTSTEKLSSRKNPMVVSNGVAVVAGGYEFWSGSQRSNTQPSYNSARSAGLTKHAAAHQNREDSDQKPRPIERQASPGRAALQQSKSEKLQAKVAAWENAKNATFLNRYKRQESKIHAWEEQEIAKASAALDKAEVELQKKRAKATEKMRSDVAKAHKKAAEMKAAAEAKRAEKTAKAAVQAQFLRVLGKSPLSCLCVL